MFGYLEIKVIIKGPDSCYPMVCNGQQIKTK